MSVCRKLPDGTIQKIAGHTILLDANASEIRQGRWNLVSTGVGWVEQNIIFTDPMPDNDYTVIIESDNQTWATQPGPYRITNKTTTGFILASFNDSNATGQANMNIAGTYTAYKPVKIEGYTALQNKVNNPDTTPTEGSTNLCTSGGIYEAIKNASSVFVGTRAEWEAEPDQTIYDIAVITDEHKVLSVDRSTGNTEEQANLNKIWQGAEADWEALPVTTKKVYDFAVIKDVHYILSVDKSTGDTTKVANVPVYDVARNPDWSRFVTITTAQAIAGYTASEDGILLDSSIYSNNWVTGTVNDVICDTAHSSARMHLIVPVSKGDVYKIVSDGTPVASQNRIYFVPYKIADSISGRSPVGAIQAYYGASDPEEGNWLVCDGRDTTGTAIELATVYPKLYRFLGNSNVLPDLRGEFLRGAGANSHSGEGSGGTVGQHQDATKLPDLYVNGSGVIHTGMHDNFADFHNTADKLSGQKVTWKAANVANTWGDNASTYVTTRPTNTSVNWIICAR